MFDFRIISNFRLKLFYRSPLLTFETFSSMCSFSWNTMGYILSPEKEPKPIRSLSVPIVEIIWWFTDVFSWNDMKTSFFYFFHFSGNWLSVRRFFKVALPCAFFDIFHRITRRMYTLAYRSNRNYENPLYFGTENSIRCETNDLIFLGDAPTRTKCRCAY